MHILAEIHVYLHRLHTPILIHLMKGHETMVCAVCLSVFLWICDMAGLFRGTFVSLWYLPRIWPSFTDMQHYCHSRYPTDDWHLTYMFSLVYFSSRCARYACFAILLVQGEIPASGSMPPSRWLPRSRENKNLNKGWPGSIWSKRGGIWTDVWVCMHYWVVIWVAG